MSLNTDRTARDNLATEDELIRQMNGLESQIIAWMATATNLYGLVEEDDQQQVLDLRLLLKSKLEAALII